MFDAPACTNCPTGLFQEKQNATLYPCKECSVGKQIDTPSTNCSLCFPGQYQDHVPDYMPICKFCRVGRYEDGYESTSCAFCEELALATDLEYVSKCDGARECAECEVGLIADIKKSVDSPHGYASCTTGYASSE
jgi:hypothetical protein